MLQIFLWITYILKLFLIVDKNLANIFLNSINFFIKIDNLNFFLKKSRKKYKNLKKLFTIFK